MIDLHGLGWVTLGLSFNANDLKIYAIKLCLYCMIVLLLEGFKANKGQRGAVGFTSDS